MREGGIPKVEYDIGFVQIFLFVLVLVALLLISFAAGFYSGKRSAASTLSVTKTETVERKAPSENVSLPEKQEVASVPTENPQSLGGEEETTKITPGDLKSLEEAKETKAADLPAPLPKKESEPTALQPQKVPPVLPSQAVASGKGYFVQIAALEEREKADAKAAPLRQRYPVIVVPPQAGEARRFYRVRLGPFPSKARADEVKREVSKEYPDAMVKQS